MTSSQLKYYDVRFLTPFSFQRRAHKFCRLPNGLLTLLISAPTESWSACSLSVATGSHNDPAEIPGLAHLCEHMVLAAGSRKYPNPGYYHEIIMKNGGSQNAFTAGEQTTFYFELPNTSNSSQEGLDETLDVFASFFSEPLFNSALINKETYAIDSEHDVNLCKESKIIYQATRLLANGRHPFSRFSTGNISTLNNVPHLKNRSLKGLLQEYFAQNFCASKMTLCLRGPHSIHSLAKLALSKFAHIENKPHEHYSRPSFSPSKSKRFSNEQVEVDVQKMNILRNTWLPKYEGQLCFTSKENGRCLFIKSSKNPTARFFFPVVERNSRFTSRDIEIMTHLWPELLGDESPGSFSHWLQKRGWVTCLYSFVSELAIGNWLLILELDLTRSGLQNLPHIIKVLFEQLMPTFVQKNTVQLAQFMSKQNCIDLIRFLYRTAEASPMEECASLSCRMQENLEALDPSCIFKGSPMMINDNTHVGNYGENKESDNWWIGQAVKFQGFLKQFSILCNMCVIISGNNVESKLEGFSSQEFKVDPFYEFEYFTSDFKPFDKTFQYVDDYYFKVPELDFPMPNICRSYSCIKKILKTSSEKSYSTPLSFTVHTDLLKKVPRLVSENFNHEMWVMTDDEDLSLHGRSILSFEIFGLDLEACPQNTMNLEILAQIVFILISPKIYPWLKLGFTCEITSFNKGDVRLGFTISGFSKQLAVFVKSIIETIKGMYEDATFISKEIFRRARILVRNNYEKAANENCANIGSIGLYIVLEKYMWTLGDRLEALEDIDMDSFRQFLRRFIDSKKYLSLFIQGDLCCADDLNEYLDRSFTHHLSGGIYETMGKTFLVDTTTILQPGTNAYIQHNGQKDDPNNSIVYFVQTGRRSDKSVFTLTDFTTFIMSLNLVLELRNKRQVGYFVVSGLRLLTNSVGLHITIMSSASPLDLESKIDEYLCYFETQLAELDEQTFHQEYVQNYLKLLNEDDINEERKTSGPTDLLSVLTSGVQIGDSEILASPVIRRHKKLQTQILQEHYDFPSESENVDIDLISQLSLTQYLIFFRHYISIHSKLRSKISIMILSSMEEKDIINKKIFLQLETFLKIKGFVIPVDELKDIVEKSGGKPRILVLELYSFFRSRDDAWRLCSVFVSELFKFLAMSLRRHCGSLAHNNTSKKECQQCCIDTKPALDLKSIDDVNFFKKVQI